MTLKLITAPDEEPVTLAQARQHLRATTTDEDALILALIFAAREQAEAMTNRALITQTWELVLDAFPCEIELPKGRIQSVTSVKYIDLEGVEQTLAAADYQVDSAGTFGARIVPAYDKTWPSTRAQLNAVTVRYVAGYGGAAAVPYSIKAAMLLLIGHLHEHREENQDFALHAMPLGAERLLSPYAVMRF